MNILGIFYAASEEDISLAKEDWKSATNAIEIYLKRKGWEVSSDHYKINGCDVYTHVFTDRDDDNPYEIVIKGTCDSDFDYVRVIKGLLNVLNNRYIVVVGKAIISSDTDPTDMDMVLVCNDSNETTIDVIRPTRFE